MVPPTFQRDCNRMEPYSKLITKIGFVAVSCTTAAWAAETFYSQFNRDAGVFGIILLSVWLAFASWLGNRRKGSESWAVLAFGSWMTIHSMIFLQIIQGEPTAWQSPWAFVTLAAICVFCYVGLRLALRGPWGGTIGWCILSFALVILYVIWDSVT